MIREREKATKIVSLLMEYYIIHEYKNINVDISIEELKGYLSHPRMEEYDSFYDRLVVTSDEEESDIL